jgi:hypothetical protein
MSKEESISAFNEMVEKARPAEGDIELSIRRLDELAAARRKDPDIEKEYEDLRDLLVEIIELEGPRYYLDSDGVKRYAYAVTPEPVEIFTEELIKMAGEGLISEEELDLAAPRKASPDGYRRLSMKDTFTNAMIVRTSKIGKGTAHVKFSAPYDAS